MPPTARIAPHMCSKREPFSATKVRQTIRPFTDLRHRPLLIDAVTNGAIDCVFQPIIDLQTGRVHCMEALAA